jgi:hypothetical protein
MTNYDAIDFSDLLAMSEAEVITHSYVKDIPLPSGKVLALVTLDNGLDYKRPNTLGPRSLMELDNTLVSLGDRAGRGEIHGVGLTGKEFILAAGADLSRVGEVPSKEMAVKLAQL